jgi:hypothetical protein
LHLYQLPSLAFFQEAKVIQQHSEASIKPSVYPVKAMLLEEILPHMNKLVSLYLTNNRRRVGWLYVDSADASDEHTAVYFLTVINGRKIFEDSTYKNLDKAKKRRERISIDEIVRIRSVQ